MTTDVQNWPVHQPECHEAPIPGRQWYSSCDPDHPRVGPDGACLECEGRACPECGRERCPDHDQPRIDRDAGLRAILDESWYPGGPTIRERVDGIGRGKMEEDS